jgi:hypothetical protein
MEQRRWEVHRAYSDEINKTRFMRVAEVWERVFTYPSEMTQTFANYWQESAKLDDALIVAIMKKGYRNEREALRDPEIVGLWERARAPIDVLQKRSAEVLAFADRNHFWLGERRYGAVARAVSFSNALIASAQQSPDDKAVALRNAALKAQYDRTQERFEHLRDTIWDE